MDSFSSDIKETKSSKKIENEVTKIGEDIMNHDQMSSDAIVVAIENLEGKILNPIKEL